MGTGLEKALPFVAASESVTNPLFQHLTNVKNRKFAREMYKTQRADSIADWNMQNEYNSPENVMARFKKAGLNPNLIYGQGNEASPVRTTSGSVPSAESPRSSIAPAIGNVMLNRAQLDLLAEQKRIAEEEILNKKADTILKLSNVDKTNIETSLHEFDLTMKEALKDYQLQAAQLNLDKTSMEIKTMFDDNERKEAMNASNISEAVERILSLREARAKSRSEREKIRYDIMIMRKEGVLKDFDIQMRNQGINPGDPGYWRVLQYIFGMLRKGKTPSARPWEGEAYPLELPKN